MNKLKDSEMEERKEMGGSERRGGFKAKEGELKETQIEGGELE